MRQRLTADVLVLGAGVAGSTVALNLAPFHKVLIIQHNKAVPLLVGESLPAAASRLLKDMGLWTSFGTQGHQPHRLSKSNWGRAKPYFNDSIRNLDGEGWHLDRPKFDRWMLSHARDRGAGVLACSQTQFNPVDATHAAWVVQAQVDGQWLDIEARWLVDATGRKSSVAKKIGLATQPIDKLVCGWLIGKQSSPVAQESEIYAQCDGWWYTSVMPDQRRLLAFYTDADLPIAQSAHNASALLAHAQCAPELASIASETNFAWQSMAHGFCSANSVTLPHYAGHRWLATGDAAMCFDPLSSQGIFNALYTGLAAATSLHDVLNTGHAQPFIDAYCGELQTIWHTYLSNRASWYQAQTRWPRSEFWMRRKNQLSHAG